MNVKSYLKQDEIVRDRIKISHKLYVQYISVMLALLVFNDI